jgi:hypothetical protein
VNAALTFAVQGTPPNPGARSAAWNIVDDALTRSDED